LQRCYCWCSKMVCYCCKDATAGVQRWHQVKSAKLCHVKTSTGPTFGFSVCEAVHASALGLRLGLGLGLGLSVCEGCYTSNDGMRKSRDTPRRHAVRARIHADCTAIAIIGEQRIL
jgi:hypothetical protein